MAIRMENRGRAVVLGLQGRLDSQAAAELEATLGRLLDEGRNHLVMDLTDAETAGGAFLRVLTSGAVRSAEAGGKLILAGPGEALRETLNLAGLEAALETSRDVETALAEL